MPPPDNSAYDRQMDALMQRVYDRAGRETAVDEDAREPLDALLAPEKPAPGADTPEERQRMQDEFEIAARYHRRFILYLFARGPHPKHAVPRLYSSVNASNPDLLLNMSGAELAAISGQCRAAESARSRALDKMLEKVTHPGASFAGGKSVTAREKMSRSARGNKNRAKNAA